MDGSNISLTVENVLNYIFIWVGMAFCTGVFAKLLVPGEKTRGTSSTFFIGFIGVLASTFLLRFFYFRVLDIDTFNPIQPTTFVVGIVLSATGLFLFRSITSIGKK